MRKLLHCSEMYQGCDFVAQGNSDDEVLVLAFVHARDKHGLRRFDLGVLAQFCSLIREGAPFPLSVHDLLARRGWLS